MRKSDVYYLLDPDDRGSTKVRIVATPATGDTWVSVKYMEPCWDCTNNILVARKGTVKSALISRLSQYPSGF